MPKLSEIHQDGASNKAMEIARSIAKDIERGLYKKNDRLPSINQYSKTHTCARDTVERAYMMLKKVGYIISLQSKGYYVTGVKKKQMQILLVFNKLGHFKKMIYDGFIQTIGKKAKVDLYVHHYNIDLFKEIIEDKKSNYHYYIIMPHFSFDTKRKDYVEAIKKIGPEKLFLLDKDLPELGKNRKGVVQNFEMDVYTALRQHIDEVNKYKKITLVIPKQSNHPKEITLGVTRFGKDYKKETEVIDDDVTKYEVKPHTLYITTLEEDLAFLIKSIRKSNLIIGKDVGILSFNETILKELLDISVVTTDFKQMGITAAEMIINNKPQLIFNPFSLIKRSSF